MDPQNLDDLQDVIREALESGELFSDEDIEKDDGAPAAMSPEQMQQLVDRLTESLAEGGYITVSPSDQARPEGPRENPTGSIDPNLERTSVRFQLSEQGIDFLGYKTLKDLLGSLGKASFGTHDTREWRPASNLGILQTLRVWRQPQSRRERNAVSSHPAPGSR